MVKIVIALGILIGAYLVLCAFIFLSQDDLIFVRRPNDRDLAARYRDSHVEIRSEGESLEGWWIEDPTATNDILVIYFGGNAEDVLVTASSSPLNAKQMLLMNYRGYGHSTGEPSQNALYQDALHIYNFAVDQKKISPSKIVLIGRSLGAAVATMLAANREVGGAVLITPFDSMVSVASRHYSFVPVPWLLRHPFPSDEWARKARAPVLILAADHDAIIPASHAKRLFEAWRGPKEFHMMKGVGHNDVQSDPNYYSLMNDFLGRLGKMKPAGESLDASVST